MSIVAMKKLRLIALRSEKKNILSALQKIGCVELREPAVLKNTNSIFKTPNSDVITIRNHISKISQALDILQKYNPFSRSFLTPLPEESMDVFFDESHLEDNIQNAEKIIELNSRIKELYSRESKERSFYESLLPWEQLDLPLETRGSLNCFLELGVIPRYNDDSFEFCVRSLKKEAVSVSLVSSTEKFFYVAVLYFKADKEKISGLLRKLDYYSVSFPDVCDTPKQNLIHSEERLNEILNKKNELVSDLKAFSNIRYALQICYETLIQKLEREEADFKILNTESTFCLYGWLSATDEKRLSEAMKDFHCYFELEDPDPAKPEEVPVKLQNNFLTRPYNLVTEMYSLPAYNGLDPNPFIMPFFALFFGIMFADLAYGFILLVFGTFVLLKAKPRGTMKHMMGLMVECGLSAMVFGFLTGGLFGDAVSVIGSWFGKDWTLVPTFAELHIAGAVISLPLNLLEGNNPLYVLIAAVALGAVHLFTGTCLGCYLKIKDGKWADAILNDFSWWIILSGLALLFLKKGPLLLYIGLGMMVAGSFITNKGFAKITGIFSAVYNGATGYLGDFLSYSRLMALMLAGSVIASVFNQLGGLGNENGVTVGGTILFVLVFIIGHTLNIALNLIGCFVHTLRLQFLEFFGKWYRDGGRAFRPLSVKTKYADICKENIK